MIFDFFLFLPSLVVVSAFPWNCGNPLATTFVSPPRRCGRRSTSKVDVVLGSHLLICIVFSSQLWLIVLLFVMLLMVIQDCCWLLFCLDCHGSLSCYSSCRQQRATGREGEAKNRKTKFRPEDGFSRLGHQLQADFFGPVLNPTVRTNQNKRRKQLGRNSLSFH